MRTEITITAANGSPLGIVGAIAELVPVMRANPDATYDIRVIVENPCAAHPKFEATSCPVCGTETRMA